MSRRASIYAKQHPEEPKRKGVRFPDELVFLDNIKENDITALHTMLRRASLKVDISAINTAGLTPMHQACLDGNLEAVKLLVSHGADINKQDEDSWTPLHAACAEGHWQIVEFLLQSGADRTIRTDEGERPLDLVEPTDMKTIRVMLENSHSSDNDNDDISDEEDETSDQGEDHRK